MRSIFSSRPVKGHPWLWMISFGVLSSAYLLQTATPLRLDDDAVDYLRMTAALTDGRIIPALPLPIGYPVVLSMLDRAGFGSSFYFVAANCLFLALGLFAVWRLLADYPARVRQATLLFTLLAIPVVKSVVIALPEATFFGISLLALLAMTSAAAATPSKQGWLLASSFACVAVAVGIRTIGLALLPALTWVCVSVAVVHEGDEQKRGARGWLIVIGLLAAGMLALVLRPEPFSVYEGWLREYYVQADIVRQIGKRVVVTLAGWGEITLNLPFSRFRDLRPGFVTAGIISLFAVVIAFRKVRTPLNPVRLYLLTYVMILAVWPNPSPRLWMPIIPLLIAEIGLVVSRLPRMRWKAQLVGAYASWFALTGIAALAYTSRISLSGADFPKLYGRNGGMPTAEVDPTDPNWAHLQYYTSEAKKMVARYGGRGARRR